MARNFVVLSNVFSTVYQPMTQASLPDIVNTGRCIRLSFKEPTQMNDSLSAHSTKIDNVTYDISYDSLASITHDLVLADVAREATKEISATDLPMEIPNGTERLRPDAYGTICGVNHCLLELKTTRGSINAAFQAAMSQYSMFAGCACDAQIRYCGLAVSETECAASSIMLMSQEQIDRLCYLCRLGHVISSLISIGVDATIITEVPKLTGEISPSSISYITDNSTIEAWRRMPQRDLMKDICKELTNPHIERLEEKVFMGVNPNSKLSSIPLLELTRTTQEDLYWLSDQCKMNPIVSEAMIHLAEARSKGKSKTTFQCKNLSQGASGRIVEHHMEDMKRGLWAGHIKDDLKLGQFCHSKSKKPEGNFPLGLNMMPRERELVVDEIMKYEKAKRNQTFLPAELPFMFELEASMYKYHCVESPYIHDDVSGIRLQYPQECWLSWILCLERLIEELNYIRFAPSRQWNTFHVNQVHPYPLYIISHSTGSKSHLFYYLLYHGHSLFGTNEEIPLRDGWCLSAHIKSIKWTKIEQYLSISERLLSLREYWVDESKHFWKKYFLHSFIIALDGKQNTLELCQYFRYLYMAFTSRIEDPRKVLTKITFQIRTAVQSHILYRMLMVCNVSRPGVEGTYESPNLRDAINWITQKKISKAQETIQLSYMHYVIKHPSPDGMIPAVAITQKILNEEAKLELSSHFLGDLPRSPDEEYLPHEFSPDFVYSLGKAARRCSEKMRGTMANVLVEWYQQMSTWGWDDVATYKKSTNPSLGSQRTTCLEQVYKLLIEDHTMDERGPFYNLDSLINMLESNDRLRHVTIFPKDQHTGTREIFVLTLVFRLCVKAIEIFSRIVNTSLACEMLSKPERKMHRNAEHSSRVQKSKMNLPRRPDGHRTYRVDFVNSSDAKTWCQQFVMKEFSCFLSGLLSDQTSSDESKALAYMVRVFNCISKKSIHLDERLVQWIQDPRTDKTEDYINLLSQIITDPDHPLHLRGGLRNISNMMQGIPHETSSSIHASYLTIMCPLIERFVPMIISKHAQVASIAICTGKVSSDDSSVQLSILFNCHEEQSPQIKEKIEKIVRSVLLGLERCKRHAAILTSPVKATICTEGRWEEFNSMWQVGNKIFPASVKFVTSAFVIGYHPRLLMRMHSAKSSIKTLLSAGVSLKQIHYIGLLLQRLNRRFLFGNDHSDENIQLWRKCCANGCVSSGYLPILPAGLEGLYDLKTTCDIASTSYHLPRLAIPFIQFENHEDVDERLNIKRATQHNALLKRLNISRPSVLSQVSKNPPDFLRNGAKGKLAVEVKLVCPGSELALTNLSESKVHSVSCYAYNSKSLQKRSNLSTFIDELASISTPPISGLDENTKIIVMQFQNTRVCDVNFSDYSLTQQHVSLLPSGYHSLRLRETILSAWFDRRSGYRTEEAFEYASSLCPDIQPSWNETISRYNNDYLRLNTDLRSLTNKESQVHYISRMCAVHEPLSVVKHLWEFNYSNEQQLLNNVSTSFRTADNLLETSLKLLSAYCFSPKEERNLLRRATAVYAGQSATSSPIFSAHDRIDYLFRVRSSGQPIVLSNFIIGDYDFELTVKGEPYKYSRVGTEMECSFGKHVIGTSQKSKSYHYQGEYRPIVSGRSLRFFVNKRKKELEIKWNQHKLMNWPLPSLSMSEYLSMCDVHADISDFLNHMIMTPEWWKQALIWKKLSTLETLKPLWVYVTKRDNAQRISDKVHEELKQVDEEPREPIDINYDTFQSMLDDMQFIAGDEMDEVGFFEDLNLQDRDIIVEGLGYQTYHRPELKGTDLWIALNTGYEKYCNHQMTLPKLFREEPLEPIGPASVPTLDEDQQDLAWDTHADPNEPVIYPEIRDDVPDLEQVPPHIQNMPDPPGPIASWAEEELPEKVSDS